MARFLVVANERFVFQSVNPLDLAELLAQDGHEVTVAAPFAPDALQWNAHRGYRLLRLDVPHGRNLPFWWAALDAARTLRPDVVIGVNTVGYLAADLIRGAGYAKRLAYYALELSIVEEAPRSLSVRWQAARARHADLVFSTGPERSHEMQERFGLREEPLWIANSPLRGPAMPSGELRRKVAEAGGRGSAILLYTGSAGRNNGLVSAARASRVWASDVVLALNAFGGSPEERHDLEQAVADANGRAVLLPPVPGGREELLRWTSGADLGLVLYDHRSDGTRNMLWYTPNKLYDYQACGLPVVASDNPTLVREVEQGGWGACCDPREPQAIARAVDDVYSRRDALAARARELFRTTGHYAAQSAQVRQRLAQLAGDAR